MRHSAPISQHYFFYIIQSRDFPKAKTFSDPPVIFLSLLPETQIICFALIILTCMFLLIRLSKDDFSIVDFI